MSTKEHEFDGNLVLSEISLVQKRILKKCGKLPAINRNCLL
jgi:hypothetical protein